MNMANGPNSKANGTHQEVKLIKQEGTGNIFWSPLNFFFFLNIIFTPQPLRAVGVLFSPLVSGWMGGRAGGGKKIVRSISRKP